MTTPMQRRSDYLQAFPGSEGGYGLAGEFVRRYGRALALFNGIDPTSNPPPATTMDPTVGAHALLEDLSKPPFRAIGRGWRIGGVVAPVAAQDAVVTLQSDPVQNVLILLDEFRFSASAAATLLYGWDTLGVLTGGTLTETEGGGTGINTLAPSAPKPLGVLAGHGTVLGPAGPITIMGAESYAAGASTIPIPFGDIVLYPGMQWDFVLNLVNTGLNYSMRGRFFPLSKLITALPSFGGG